MPVKNKSGFILGTIILLAIFIATKPEQLFDILLPFVALSLASLVIYNTQSVKSIIIGVDFKHNFWFSVISGALMAGLYYIITLFTPGASIGLPITPNTVTNTLRFYIVGFVAPFIEEPFFRGGVLGYLRTTEIGTKHISFAIIGSSVLFALAHVGAYITGLYSYPNLGAVGVALGANFASFLAAFLFGLVTAYFVTRKATNNLAFAIVFHMLVNIIILTSLSII